MKSLKNNRVFEDNNNMQYFLENNSTVYKLIDLKDRIIIDYNYEGESNDNRPIYCFSKKDGKILWQVQNPALVENADFEETASVSVYGFYKIDEKNGEKLSLYSDYYAERMAMFWYTEDKYIKITQRMSICNNKGELKESEQNIILEDLTQEEKDTLLEGDDVSGPIWYSKPDEEYNSNKYKIICKMSHGEGQLSFCFLNPENGELEKMIDTY